MNPKVAVVYTDQGPGGICGQDINTTSCWTKVWLFESFEEAVKFTEKYPVAENALGTRSAQRRITSITATSTVWKYHE